MLRWIARNDRLLTAGGLLAVVVLCWTYLIAGAGTMQDMGGMSMPMTMWPWTLLHAFVMLSMWIVMMAAMMLPSAMSVILLYSTITTRETSTSKHARLATSLFAVGYLAVWIAFSAAAVGLQFLLEWRALLSPMMEATSIVLSGVILIAVGFYQLTPLKSACLRQCRSPLEYLMSHWRKGWSGAFRMGLGHGAYCVGCCWGLMLLLFVGGLMNYLWIAGIALFVLLEKFAPRGESVSRLAAFPLIIWGIFLLYENLALTM